MGGVEASLGVGGLIDLDDGEGRSEGKNGSNSEGEVYPGALPFLRWGVGRLKDEDCLGSEEHTGRVEELPRADGGKG